MGWLRQEQLVMEVGSGQPPGRTILFLEEYGYAASNQETEAWSKLGLSRVEHTLMDSRMERGLHGALNRGQQPGQ